ncbi:MAG TPA: SGNH/GDSL hydrolase family protein [Luteolibacter sp.]
MNPLTSFFTIFLACAGIAAAAPSKIAAQPVPGVERLAGKRVLILGDSITQAGSYVSFMEYFLQKGNPGKSFDIVSAGLGSETTSGLSEPGHAGGAFPRPCVHERLDRALRAVKPAVVLACYGMNDGIYQPYDETRMKAFRDGITKLASEAKSARADVVLITPPVFERADRAVYEPVLAKFAEWEVQHPPAGVVAVVDLHTPMNAALVARRAVNPAFKFTTDGIHPGELGHLVMALEIIKGLGAPTPEGTPEKILADIKADPLFALVNKRRVLRSSAWLAHIGYTREKKVAPKTGDIAATEREVAALQVEIDTLRRKAVQ